MYLIIRLVAALHLDVSFPQPWLVHVSMFAQTLQWNEAHIHVIRSRAAPAVHHKLISERYVAECHQYTVYCILINAVTVDKKLQTECNDEKQ